MARLFEKFSRVKPQNERFLSQSEKDITLCAHDGLPWLQSPPVIEQPSIAVPLSRGVLAISNSATGLTLDPLLAVAVFGVLDILSGGLMNAIDKLPINIPGVRNIMPCDNLPECMILLHTHLSPI